MPCFPIGGFFRAFRRARETRQLIKVAHSFLRSDFSGTSIVFRHRNESKLLLWSQIWNDASPRIDSLEKPGRLECQRPMPSNYNYELTYECCFLNKEANKFLAEYQGMWRKYRNIFQLYTKRKRRDVDEERKGTSLMKKSKKKKEKKTSGTNDRGLLFILK